MRTNYPSQFSNITTAPSYPSPGTMMDRSLNDTRIYGTEYKNPKTDLGLNVKIRKAKAAKPLENSYLF